MSEIWTYRYDTLPFKHYEIDTEGYLRFIAPIAKVGMLRYWDSEKNEYYEEFVPEKTLIDSAHTFKTKPITHLHPSVKVSPTNSRMHSRGLTGHLDFFDKAYLWLTGTVTDQELIEKAVKGDCKELSCGYDALVAVADSKRFQAKRKGNHLAFVPQGRAGREVSLKLDGIDEVISFVEYHCDDDLSDVSVPDSLYDHFRDGKIIVPISSPEKKDSKESKKKMPVQILLQDQVFSIDGDDANSLKTVLTSFVKDTNDLKETVTTLESFKVKADNLTNQVATLTADKASVDGELVAAKVKLDEASKVEVKTDADQINTAIQTRLTQWSEVLPFIQKADSSFKPDYNLDEHQIRKEYLLKRIPDQKTYLDSVDLTTESGQKLIEGMYLGLKPSTDVLATTTTHSDGVFNLIIGTTPEQKQDAVSKSEAARIALQKKLEGVTA